MVCWVSVGRLVAVEAVLTVVMLLEVVDSVLGEEEAFEVYEYVVVIRDRGVGVGVVVVLVDDEEDQSKVMDEIFSLKNVVLLYYNSLTSTGRICERYAATSRRIKHIITWTSLLERY